MTIKWTKQDVDGWVEMYSRPMEIADISAATGAKKATIQYRLVKRGIRLRNSRGPAPNPKQRFDAKWTPEPNTGCWLWSEGTDWAGYGYFRHAGELLAHRCSYVLHSGPIPTGLHVLHKCDVPACVNPEHLFLGTHQDNMTDCKVKGRTQRANAKKTHCPQGHEYSSDNVRRLANGGRGCKACERVKAARWRRNNLEAARARDRRTYWAKKGQQSDA